MQIAFSWHFKTKIYFLCILLQQICQKKVDMLFNYRVMTTSKGRGGTQMRLSISIQSSTFGYLAQILSLKWTNRALETRKFQYETENLQLTY